MRESAVLSKKALLLKEFLISGADKLTLPCLCGKMRVMCFVIIQTIISNKYYIGGRHVQMRR